MIYEILFKGGQLTIAVSAEKCYIVHRDEATNSIVAPNTLNENLKPGEKKIISCILSSYCNAALDIIS